ncbi:hypothetical protein LINPERPRIM_LOCUS37367 [Linum perenne]
MPFFSISSSFLYQPTNPLYIFGSDGTQVTTTNLFRRPIGGAEMQWVAGV